MGRAQRGGALVLSRVNTGLGRLLSYVGRPLLYVSNIFAVVHKDPTVLPGPVLFEAESKAIRNPSRRFMVSKSEAERARLRKADM